MRRLSIALGSLTLLVVSCVFGEPSQASTVVVDEDRDGLDDRFEQSLLEKFAPAFHISDRECDGKPSEFRQGVTEPQSASRNGTIYGQVFPRPSVRLPGSFVEIHYYHLWARDCGRSGHALDAEHVSVLVTSGNSDRDAENWKAVFWYAAAHEDTVCDFSSASKANELGAEDHGPDIWISRGKHASFLSREACTWGCGGDVCVNTSPLRPAKIINIGESDAYLNGSSWVVSKRWPLMTKLGIDFTDNLIAFLGNTKLKGVLILNPHLRPAQAVLLAGDSTADALDISGRKTGTALGQAGNRTDRALQATAGSLDQAQEATAEALAGSARKTGGALAATGSATGNAVAVSATSTGRSVRSAVKKTFSFLGASRKN